MFEFGASHKHVGPQSGAPETPKLDLVPAGTKSSDTIAPAPCYGLRLNFRVADNSLGKPDLQEP